MMSVANPPLSSVKGIHNFNAGPSVLPKEVFEEASRAVLDFIIRVFLFSRSVTAPLYFKPVMEEARSGKRTDATG